MSSSKNIRYIPAIDHLRAYAAVMVLLFHMGYRHLGPWPRGNFFTSVVYEGHTGVALFLVLSGFIFTYGSAGREIDYKTFLLNRILRIYPLMITLIMIGVSAFGERLSVAQVLGTLLPVQNLRGLTPTTPLGIYNAVFWTISVECQFYLIFPFLYRQLLARGIQGLLPLMAFLLLARWSAVLLGANPQVISYFTIIGRLDQFLIGMFAATLALRLTFSSALLRRALPVGIAGLWVALYFFNQAGGFPSTASWRILWPTIEAALWALIILGYLATFQGRNGLVSQAVAGVGTVSYSMYLIHGAVINIMTGRGFIFEVPGGRFMSDLVSGLTCVFPVVVLVSTLSYHAIEKPFLGLRRKYLDPASNAPPAPAVPVRAARESEAEAIPGAKWLVVGLAAFCGVMLMATTFANRARLQAAATAKRARLQAAADANRARLQAEAAAARAAQESFARLIAGLDASHPSTCKVLIVQIDDVSWAVRVGQQLEREGKPFIVSGQRWKTRFGANRNWQALDAETLHEGLVPWYIVPNGAIRPGVPANAPVCSLDKDTLLMSTPPGLDLSAVGSMANFNFLSNGNAGDFALGGWSNMDPGGTWTVEPWAALAFRPQVVVGSNVEVFVDGEPCLAPIHGLTRQRVRLYFNGTPIGSEQQFLAAGTVQFTIPAATWNAVAAKAEAQASLALELPDAAAPATLDPKGGNNDNRKLGVFISRIRLRVAP